MKNALAIRNPVGVPRVLDTSSTSVTSSAYVDLVTAAQMTVPAAAILIHNPGSQPLKLASGAAGAEVDLFVVPINAVMIVPIELKKSVRLSLKSMGATQSSGIITISFLA